MRITLSLLKPDEINRASRIVGKNYSKNYEQLAKKEFREMFGKSYGSPLYFVAKDKGNIVGVAGFIQSWMDYSVYEIFWVNILPERQKQGIGKEMVSRIICEIKKKKNAEVILLTANQEVGNPTYYKKQFGFKSLQKFGKSYQLMSLSLRL